VCTLVGLCAASCVAEGGIWRRFTCRRGSRTYPSLGNSQPQPLAQMCLRDHLYD